MMLRGRRFLELLMLLIVSLEKIRNALEVTMGVSGNVDYVALKINENGTNADDFLCIEFQANGTTGSPYPYVRDLLQNGRYTGSYTYGLNWANEFMKTMMQQVYKKGQVVAHLLGSI